MVSVLPVAKALGFFSFPCQPEDPFTVYSLQDEPMPKGNDMLEPMLKFSVTCPNCALKSVSEIPIALIANALLTGKGIRLHSVCHDHYWTATFAEREQLRESLSVLKLEPHPPQERAHAEKIHAAG